ncbi:MAG TPA: DUF5107 domain-containing protein [Chitinophagaceae bacterium]|nr:DUF5107 domain-containing protein [Chitinophagaceae bacterium]
MIAKYFLISLTGVIILMLPFYGAAQDPTTVREYDKTFTTYPFSQPDPVANQAGIYPYFRFDGFTDKPVQKQWKVVALENDFIKVLIMPQIGGKIWTAIDKKNGKPFIYDNDVIKFRDIAMRGAWTSGGIEINYGIIGHTPGVATPVNYLTRKNADGSASCVISLLDLLTQTRWSLEIRLPRDKAYFITKSVWHNGTALYQPYYTWMNMAQKVSDSLEYIFPGTHHIFHDGKAYPWPYNQETHKRISVYGQNDFGGSKSYHVVGTYSKYFGAYWQKENFGMIHYAARQDKIGKKIFIWGLSKHGMIWEKILTDHAGQYTEMQSGRLYNQNNQRSIFSPFKQFYFMPYNTDTWKEYWYPFQNTDGVSIADLNGVINLKQKPGEATIFISPVSDINDTLKVLGTDGSLLFSKPVKLKPLQSFKQNVRLKKSVKIARVTLAGSVVNLLDSAARVLDRPVEPYPDFDWESAYGLYLRGAYEAGTRHYAKAEQYVRSSLEKIAYFMPALTAMAFLQYKNMNYDSAFYYARKALSVDTYDPAANYYYGLAALQLGKWYDAEDGFQMATLTPQFRVAAYTELSKMQLQKRKYKKAFGYAQDALAFNTENITALQLQYIAVRSMNDHQKEEVIKERILQLDPLNNFIRFEAYWEDKTAPNREKFTKLIRDELPQQTYLHLADWYMQLGLVREAAFVLETAPRKDDEISYWLAYLHRNDRHAKKWLDSADAGSPLFIFPFRPESFRVMQWAMKQTDNWKPEYYMALIDISTNHKTKALQLLEAMNPAVNFAPLYVTRARLRDSSDAGNILSDFSRAASLDKKDWRYGKYLTEFLLVRKQVAKALKTIGPYYKEDRDNYIAGMLYTRCLILNNQYTAAEKVLNNLHILPYEGATDGHRLYKQVKLMLALQLLQSGKYQAALRKVSEAREWPAHLGVGKPYPNMIKDSLENKIQDIIQGALQGRKPSGKAIDAIKSAVQ